MRFLISWLNIEMCVDGHERKDIPRDLLLLFFNCCELFMCAAGNRHWRRRRRCRSWSSRPAGRSVFPTCTTRWPRLNKRRPSLPASKWRYRPRWRVSTCPSMRRSTFRWVERRFSSRPGPCDLISGTPSSGLLVFAITPPPQVYPRGRPWKGFLLFDVTCSILMAPCFGPRWFIQTVTKVQFNQ